MPRLARAAAAFVAAAVAAAAPVATADTVPLRDLAAKNGIMFGAAANHDILSGSAPDQAQYAGVLKGQFSLITAENACKWSPTEPTQGQYDFSGCDFLLNWTRQEGVNQTFRGHNLCWGSHNPDWLSKLPTDQLRQALADHINTVVPHYKEAAYGWDVVNEAISDGGGQATLFKNTTWYPAVPDYVDFSFKTARAAAAGADIKLFYNDYNVASADGWSAAKSDRMYSMVKDMQSRGIPIDGVGLQLHVDVNYDLATGVAKNIARYHDLGIEVHCTEVDVGCVPPTGSNTCDWTPEEEQKQAEVYAALLQVCLDSPACKNFETWGVGDAHTWRTGLHPLLFNETYGDKPATRAIRDVLEKNLVGDRSDWVDRYYARVAQQAAAAMPAPKRVS